MLLESWYVPFSISRSTCELAPNSSPSHVLPTKLKVMPYLISVINGIEIIDTLEASQQILSYAKNQILIYKLPEKFFYLFFSPSFRDFAQATKHLRHFTMKHVGVGLKILYKPDKLVLKRIIMEWHWPARSRGTP